MDIYNNNAITKELFLENELLPDLGIMMSYGDDDGLVTMGIFFIGGYYDETGKKLDVLPDDKTGVEVEFIEYELSDDLEAKVKPNGCTVRMPYNKAKKLYGDAGKANFDKAYDLCDETELEGRDFLSLFNEVLCNMYADNPELATEGFLGFQSNTVRSLDASFMSSDGHDMGDNYRVFPFLYDMIRRKYRERDITNKLDKDKLYNYVYALYYDVQKEKVKEREIEIGGTIYEPGPGSVPLPKRYYEEEGELEREVERDRPMYR